MINLNEVITDENIFFQGYIIRDGFVFMRTISGPPKVFDTILLKEQKERLPEYGGIRPMYYPCERTLEEQIEFVNKHQLEKAYIITDDISFITRCPSLKYLRIMPVDTKEEGFDYSPLYAMPEIRYLLCHTTDAERRFHIKAPIDYAKINGLQEVNLDDMFVPEIYDKINYNQIKTLRKMKIRGFKSKYRNVTDLFISPVLEDLEILQSNIRSMEGIDTSKNMKSLALYYNRSLADLSALEKVSESLTKLSIDACAKITDFSFLYHLPNLQFLDLRGSNVLKSLEFLHHMKNLKTFILDMDVEDGDLTPCLSIPDVRSARNRRHFNLKNEELPKPPQT